MSFSAGIVAVCRLVKASANNDLQVSFAAESPTGDSLSAGIISNLLILNNYLSWHRSCDIRIRLP